jgi:hypothetical protein
MSPTEVSIPVTSDDPKKKDEKADGKGNKAVASKLKEDPKPGEGEELVRFVSCSDNKYQIIFVMIPV